MQRLRNSLRLEEIAEASQLDAIHNPSSELFSSFAIKSIIEEI